ncbi:MAG: DUF5017 domain-containing protein [Alistipes sp.]|nr:DUF5017 domain-containing protein [Alistipes sp.]
MKRYLLPIWLLGLAAGCQEALVEPTFEAPQTAVRFTGAGAAATRTVVEADGTTLGVAWSTTDAVGIFGRGATTGDNYPYAAAPERNDPTRCTFASADLGKIFRWNRGEQNFYAYYPYDEEADAEPNALPVVLPTRQQQTGAGSTDHLAGLSVMKAAPVTRVFSEEEPAPVEFAFRNLFAMVEIRLKMGETTAIDVPLRQIRLLSDATPLTIAAGTADLTAPADEDALTIAEGKHEAVLVFGEQPVLTKTGWQSFWLMVAPGQHPAGTLKLETTAIDNSTCTVELPAVTFKANRNYRQEATLSLDEFEPAEAFAAVAAATECRAGEPVVFALSGEAETVDFYSGEKFHEWEYAAKDRLEYSDVFFSFRAQMQCTAAKYQAHPVSVKVSTDFDGTFEETNILAATWTDISARFTLPSKPWTANDGPTTEERYMEEGRMISSGEANLSGYYDEKSPYLYVAFFYHIDKYDANLLNERTGVWFTDIQATRQEGETRAVILSQTEAEVHVIDGANYGTTHSRWGKTFEHGGVTHYPWEFWCESKPKADRDAYAVMNRLERKVSNFGPDKPQSVKGGGTAMPETFSYAFAEPGTYEAVLVGRSKTLTDEKEVICKFTVTVKP